MEIIMSDCQSKRVRRRVRGKGKRKLPPTSENPTSNKVRHPLTLVVVIILVLDGTNGTPRYHYKSQQSNNHPTTWPPLIPRVRIWSVRGTFS